MSNETRTLDPVYALNHSMPAAKRISLGDRLEEQAVAVNGIIDAINAAGVTGLSVSTSLKVTQPSTL